MKTKNVKDQRLIYLEHLVKEYESRWNLRTEYIFSTKKKKYHRRNARSMRWTWVSAGHGWDAVDGRQDKGLYDGVTSQEYDVIP